MSFLAQDVNHPVVVPGCATGHHRPLREAIEVRGDIHHSVCRRCACSLIRTGASRRWIRSGLLG